MAEAPSSNPPSPDQGQEEKGGASVGGRGFAVLAIYARRRDIPIPVHILIIFGVIFVLSLLAVERSWMSVAIVASVLLMALTLVTLVSARTGAKIQRELQATENHLSRFLGIPPEGGRIGIYLPVAEATHDPLGGEPYAVRSMAYSDVRAAVEIICLLNELDMRRGSSAFVPSALFISESVVDSFDGDTLFFLGGPIPNVFVGDLVKQNPYVELEDLGEVLRLRVGGLPEDALSMRPPRRGRTIREAEREPTYGCVMKVTRGKRTTFAVWGLDARGTLGAGRWLAEHWQEPYDRFGKSDFTAIIRIPAGVTSADDVQPHPDANIPMLIPTIPNLS